MRRDLSPPTGTADPDHRVALGRSERNLLLDLLDNEWERVDEERSRTYFGTPEQAYLLRQQQLIETIQEKLR